MQNLLVVLATAEPSPGEDLREGLDPEMVTPGTLGFLATLFVVIATVFLIRDMAKRVRRVRYREQVQRQADGQNADDGGTSEGEIDDVGPGSRTPGSRPDDGDGDPADRGSGDGDPTDRGSDDGDPTDRGPDDGDTRRLKNSNGAGPDRKG